MCKVTRKRARVRGEGRAEEEGRGEEGSEMNKVKVGIHLHIMLREGCWVIQGLREEDKKRTGKHQTGWLECREGSAR